MCKAGDKIHSDTLVQPSQVSGSSDPPLAEKTKYCNKTIPISYLPAGRSHYNIMHFFRLVGSAEVENLLCTTDHMRIAQFRFHINSEAICSLILYFFHCYLCKFFKCLWVPNSNICQCFPVQVYFCP